MATRKVAHVERRLTPIRLLCLLFWLVVVVAVALLVMALLVMALSPVPLSQAPSYVTECLRIVWAKP